MPRWRCIVPGNSMRGLAEWSLPIDQRGEGVQYYGYDPQEARRLLAEAGHPKGFKTLLTTTGGYGRDLIDAVEMLQRDLKEVGIEVERSSRSMGRIKRLRARASLKAWRWAPTAVVGTRIACCTAPICQKSSATAAM